MYKSNTELIVIDAKATEPIPTNVVFWSHDKGTAKMLFQLQKDYVNQTLSEGTIVPICLDFVGGRHIYHAVIEDAVNGIVSIVLEDNILGYQGRVDGSIYIELPDSRSLDTAGRFTFQIKRSPIDEDVPELKNYYWQGFREIMEQYHESIAKIKSESKALLDSLTADVTTAKTKVTQLEQSINTANTNLNARIDEISKKIDDNDVYTKAESSANVVNQIGGTESTIVPEKLLVDGNAGVAARNVNGTIRSFSQTDYDNLNSNIVIGTDTATNGNAAQFEFNMDVIAYIDSKYPSVFAGLTSTSDKLNKLKLVLKTIKVPHTARGSVSSKFDWWNYQAGSWAGLNLSNTDSGFVEKIYEISSMNDVTFSRAFGNTGIFKTRIYSGMVSDGSQKSWIELKGFSLIIELEISAKEIIDYSIAANHVENLATQEEAVMGEDNTKAMTPLRTKQLLDAKLLNMVYPIGSIYMSVNSATPATLFGGTWERFSKGRVLVGVDESDTVLATSGKQGGSTNPLTTHTHTTQLTTYRVTSTGSGAVNNLARSTDQGNAMTGEFGSVTSSGDNTDHKNWQPFDTVYIWKRTA